MGFAESFQRAVPAIHPHPVGRDSVEPKLMPHWVSVCIASDGSIVRIGRGQAGFHNTAPSARKKAS